MSSQARCWLCTCEDISKHINLKQLNKNMYHFKYPVNTTCKHVGRGRPAKPNAQKPNTQRRYAKIGKTSSQLNRFLSVFLQLQNLQQPPRDSLIKTHRTFRFIKLQTSHRKTNRIQDIRELTVILIID